MTTPHPTPEERYEAAQDLLALETSRKIEEALVRHYLGGTPQRQAAIQIIVSAAIREAEAEAAGEARGDDVLIGALASLAAAISLLERMPKAKKAAPSDKMFEQMLTDYRNALEAGRSFARARANKDSSDV